MQEQRHHSATSWSPLKTINSRFDGKEQSNSKAKHRKEKKRSPNHWCQVIGEIAYKKNIVECEATKQTPMNWYLPYHHGKNQNYPSKKHDQHSIMEEDEEDD